MKTYKEFIVEAGGSEAGSLELVRTTLEVATKYAETVLQKNGRVLMEEIPNFADNYQKVQMSATQGRTQRKDMPVISSKDIKDFQKRLTQGFIDINHPYSDKESEKNPFPKGLAGGNAEMWLRNGLEVFDGSKTDDKVTVKQTRIKMSDLKPIQHQIYFDNSMDRIAAKGSKVSISFLTNKSTFIVSNDNFIIDGHHRWLTGNLIDPNLKTKALSIDLPLAQLLPLSLSYSDARGNKRNL